MAGSSAPGNAGSEAAGDKSLWTEKEYGDFSLRFDYQLEPGGNSGVYVRVPENALLSHDLFEGFFARAGLAASNGEARREEFENLELDAKNARRGLWGSCNPLPPACS